MKYQIICNDKITSLQGVREAALITLGNGFIIFDDSNGFCLATYALSEFEENISLIIEE